MKAKNISGISLSSLPGHQEKPNLLCFHPQASSLLATAGFDCHLFIWDLEERAISLRMDTLPQPVRISFFLLMATIN